MSGVATCLVPPEQEAAPAQAACKSWGYRTLGRLQPGPEMPVYDLLLRDLL